MKVVITGGAGFIGGHLADACVDAGDEVTCVDDLSSGRRDNCRDSDLIVGDITDAACLDRAFRGADVVYHLAARRAVALSVEDPAGTDSVNTAGTLQVLLAAKRADVPRVVSVSSSSVYGGLAPVPTKEDATLTPKSPYAVSKVAGEHYARVFAELYGLETVVLRPFNVYGPRQRPDSQYAAVIPLFLKAAAEQTEPVIHGTGSQSRDFTFVSDCVAVLLAAGRADAARVMGKAFNAAAGGETTVLELWKHISSLFSPRTQPRFEPARAGDVPRSRADISAARECLGYEPRVSLSEGIRATAEWMQLDGR